MKYLLLLATLVATLSVAGETLVPATSVKDAKKMVEQKCTKGCLILTPEEVKNIEANITKAMNEVGQDAFEQGKQICNKSI